MDANGKTTSYANTAYDGLNRIKQKSYSDGTTQPVTYSYDTASPNGLGRLASVVSGTATTSYGGYDQVGRVSSSTETLGS